MDLKLKNNTNLILPRYIPVEYIETSGNVAIDTGVSISSSTNYTIETTLEILSNTNKIGRIYGTIYNNTIWYMGLFASASSSTDCVARSILNARRTSDINISLDGKTDIVHTNSYIKVNNTTYDFTGNNGTPNTYNLRLFYQHNTNYGIVTGKIWKFKVKISDNVVVDYVPCLSTELNHFGEPALYDKVSSSYKYPTSTGSFSAPSIINFYDTITSAYIKDCPNIDGIDLLRRAINLNRIRCNINSSTGHTAEIYKYAQLSGFNDAGEQQTKPRIVGTFNIDDYYTDAEVAEIRSKIDGITVTTPTASDYNVDTLLENDDLAIQTLDSTKPNYNPAAAIRLYTNGYGHTVASSHLLNGEGRFFITKDEVATITSLSKNIFGGIASAVDSNKIVSNDDTEEYLFTSFDEFKYFIGMRSIPNGASSTSPRNIFAGCSNLQSITLPEGVTTIGTYAFFRLNNLSILTLPSTITQIQDYNFSSSGYTPNLHTVYFNGTLNQWMGFTRASSGNMANPCTCGADLYIQGELLENLVIPEGITSIKTICFANVRSLKSVIIPNSVTSIGASAFHGCSGLTTVVVLATTPPTLGANAFSNNASGRVFYVPYSADHSVLAAYKAATNWSSFESVIYELNEDGTITE